ncbi:hypothetical protein BC832DRAFT_543181 [Gaertneriomyces semiglobifer]|nr:hypothetical protein BC832DRAFT_543181 [Gaertneriomyces semiglobifer]
MAVSFLNVDTKAKSELEQAKTQLINKLLEKSLSPNNREFFTGVELRHFAASPGIQQLCRSSQDLDRKINNALSDWDAYDRPAPSLELLIQKQRELDQEKAQLEYERARYQHYVQQMTTIGYPGFDKLTVPDERLIANHAHVSPPVSVPTFTPIPDTPTPTIPKANYTPELCGVNSNPPKPEALDVIYTPEPHLPAPPPKPRSVIPPKPEVLDVIHTPEHSMPPPKPRSVTPPKPEVLDVIHTPEHSTPPPKPRSTTPPKPEALDVIHTPEHSTPPKPELQDSKCTRAAEKADSCKRFTTSANDDKPRKRRGNTHELDDDKSRKRRSLCNNTHEFVDDELEDGELEDLGKL